MNSPPSSDETDIILLDLLQDEIPLISNPWELIAQKAGISQEEVLVRLNRLADTGVLRGIAPILESDMISPRVSTLIAVRVPEKDIQRVAALVNQYSEVSHNFRREHAYNLWFTLSSRSRDHIDTILAEIQSLTGIHPDDILDLVTEKKYKIDVRFPLRNKKDTGRQHDGRD